MTHRAKKLRGGLAVLAAGTGSTLAAFVVATSSSSCGSSTVSAHHDASKDAPIEAPLPEAGPTLPVAPVGHHGRWLTDALGRVLLVHGVNVVNKDPPFYPAAQGFSDADAAWLADAGFRVVRVGILASGLMPKPGSVDLGYVRHVAQTVRDLGNHQIYSLIDVHQDGWGPTVGSDGFPAWMTLTGSAKNVPAPFPFYYTENPALQQAFQSFWDDAPGPDGRGLQEDYVAMLSAVARQFADDPYVLGYDLFNEPWPGNDSKPCMVTDGCPSQDESELGAVYAKAVGAIRAAGDRHLVFGEPFVLFNYGTSATHIPVPGGDSNAGMAFHVYPLVLSQAPDAIRQAVAWSSRTGGALLNTEWGATTLGSAITTQTTDLDSALLPWIFWSFYSEVVAALDQPPSGKNLVESTVQALVEPYPLAVAGTPQKLSYDGTSHAMAFTWSTDRAAGGTFPAGTVTTFEVPALTYPGGYGVTVTNGVAVSASCAPLLTVMAEPGATSVDVRIAPGACR